MGERRHAPRRRLPGALLVIVALGPGSPAGCMAERGTMIDPPERAELGKVADDTAGSRAVPVIAVNEATTRTPGAPGADEAKRSTERTPGGASDNVLVTLRTEDLRSPLTAPLEITVTARNASGEDIDLLIWNTPFEPVLSADVFSVERDGERRPYRGRTVKRALPPREGDVVRLAPGETLERVVDLSRFYAFDAPGRYEIRFVPRAVPIDGEEAGLATLAAADAEALEIVRY